MTGRLLAATCAGALMALAPTWSVAEGNGPTTLRNEPLLPLPASPPVSPAMAALGRALFHDTRLSGDGTVSCATCHPLDAGGMDGLPRAVGVGGAEGVFNTPTVYNAALNFRQFWNGRAASLEEQVDGPILAPGEMGATWPKVVAALRDDPAMAAAFAPLFPDGITPANIRRALADFERTLLTPDSPFDRYLLGDPQALSADETAGYRLFKKYGCSSCHQGANVGGNLYEKMGIVRPYFTGDRTPGQADLGRFAVTGVESHRFEFKVPSLRNVALTPPYLHDGSVETLEEMVRLMAYHQLGREIPPDDAARIVRFLGALTGRHPELAP